MRSEYFCPGVRARTTGRVSVVIAMALAVATGALASGCRRVPAPAAGPATKPAIITTKTGVEMVLIPSGEFIMGDINGEQDERPAHRVRISAFYLDRTEVTQESFQALTGRNSAKFKNPASPVERVSWNAAAKYCNLRSLREGFRPCYDARTLACDYDANGYRLPTEAEWEYACRAGTTTPWSFGSDEAGLANHAWFRANAAKGTHPVKGRRANAWGLFDMHGNVAEWCGDWYDPNSYLRPAGEGADAVIADPPGPSAGRERVLRGGSWKNDAAGCRSGARAAEEPGLADVCFGYDAYGFRCVRAAPAPPARPIAQFIPPTSGL